MTARVVPGCDVGTWAAIAFVPLWSSGVLFGALALRGGPPFAVTALRFAIAAVLMAGLAALRRSAIPSRAALGRAALGHAAMVGLLLQGGHYAGIYAGLAAGMPAGVAGLIVGLIPVVTAVGAVPLLGEPFTRRRAAASLLGAVAAALVSWHGLGGGSGAAMALGALALFSGAGSALWQKRFGVGGADLVAATVQLLVGTVVMAVCWALLEQDAPSIAWTGTFVVSFGWLIVANSVGANLLLLWLLARGAAGRVTGLFFLVPPFTAAAAAPMLNEWPQPTTLLAIALGAAAVRLLMTERR